MAKKLKGMELLEYLRSGEVVMEMRLGSTHVIFRDTAYRDKTPEEIQRDCKRVGDAVRRATERAYKGLSYEEGKALWERGQARQAQAEETCGAIEWIKGKPEPCTTYKMI